MRARRPPTDGYTPPTWLTLSRPPLTRSRKAHIEHPRRSRSRLGCAPHRARRADRVRPRGRMLTLPKTLWRVLGDPARSRGRRGRRGGPRSGSRASGVAAREPRRGQPIAGCAAASYRPTRLERLDDLESRAPCGGDRSRRRRAAVEPSAASPRDRLANRSAPAEGKERAHVSVCERG